MTHNLYAQGLTFAFSNYVKLQHLVAFVFIHSFVKRLQVLVVSSFKHDNLISLTNTHGFLHNNLVRLAQVVKNVHHSLVG